MHHPWLFAEDFNDIPFSDKMKGGAVVCVRRCNKFVERKNASKLLVHLTNQNSAARQFKFENAWLLKNS